MSVHWRYQCDMWTSWAELLRCINRLSVDVNKVSVLVCRYASELLTWRSQKGGLLVEFRSNCGVKAHMVSRADWAPWESQAWPLVVSSVTAVFTQSSIYPAGSSHFGKIVFTSWTHMNATTKSQIRVGCSGFSLSSDLHELRAFQWEMWWNTTIFIGI